MLPQRLDRLFAPLLVSLIALLSVACSGSPTDSFHGTALESRGEAVMEHMDGPFRHGGFQHR